MTEAFNRNATILIIDDEQAIRGSFRLYLEDCGFGVLEAESGRIGIRLFDEEQPELVLVDLRMPEVDGLQVLSHVVSRSPDTPVLVVSGTGLIEDVIEALRLGAWDYLLKPVEDLSVLLHAVRKNLERSRLTRENRTYQEQLEEEVRLRTEELSRANEELRRTNRQLTRSEEKYRAIFESLTDVYFQVTTDGTIEEISPSVESILHHTREEMLGSRLWDYFSDQEQVELLREKLRLGRVTDHEVLLKDGGGGLCPCSITAAREASAVGERMHGVFRDVTERKLAQAKIEHQAYHDSLTGLPNRSLLLDRLELALNRSRRHGYEGALLLIDLDRFKTINDSLGHGVGDKLLCEVARRLQEALREEDTVARIGGDEFVVLLSDIGSDTQATARRAQSVAEKIRQALSRPIRIRDHELYVTPSIGITLFPMQKEDADADSVLRHGDTAMYQAKESGRDAIRFFLPAMQSEADRRLLVEKDLRLAISGGQLRLFFQPQIDDQGRICGAEGLLRWQHPEQGLVEPARFIPLAEETGLILPIGNWVLRTVCELIAHWHSGALQLSLGHVSVNVSPWQFRQPDFPAQVQRIVAETGADPRRLGLELTEGVVIDSLADTAGKMNAFKAMGVRIAIDDFGTGYSSLSYLKRLPLDILKIDRGFVEEVTADESHAAIVGVIIAMAGHLGLEVVAEGVETEGQLQFLQRNGCRRYQGYYFSKPLPVAEFEDFVTRRYDSPGDLSCA